MDDGCTRVAVYESFASKNTCVTADLKQRIRLRFVLNIADTDQLKNALIGPDTESLRSDWDIPGDYINSRNHHQKSLQSYKFP